MNQVRYSSRASSGTCSVKIAPLPSAAPASGLMSGLTQDVIRQPRPAPLPVSAEVLRTEALYKDAGYVLPHGAVVPNAGTSGAHQREICPEALRTAEISAAGQALCHVHPPRSDTPRHRTRPTGRLTRLFVLRPDLDRPPDAPEQLLDPAKLPHGPARVPDLGHVADLAVLELHHIDVVAAGALAGWRHRSAVGAVGA